MKILLCALVLAILTPHTVLGEVRVNSKYQSQVYTNQSVSVLAGNYSVFPIKVTAKGNIDVKVQVLNQVFDDGTIWVCDAVDFHNFEQNRNNDCRGISRKRNAIEFSFHANGPGVYYLIADNTFSLLETKHYQISVSAPAIMELQLHRDLVELLTGVQNFISSTFIAPQFNLSIEPCGIANAYSSSIDGSITLCTEFIFQQGREGSVGALMGVLWHEMGHTFLNLWGLPNYANEETADEFATYMLLLDGDTSLIQGYADYFLAHDSLNQARRIIAEGDTHPLSIQRARNILKNASNPAPFVSRWNRVVYPNMLDSELRRIARSPGRFESSTIAESVLHSRGVTR